MRKRRDEQPDAPNGETTGETPPPQKTEEPGLEQKLADLEDRYRRSVAEMANAQKRFDRDRRRTSKLAVARFVEALLPMIDNMVHSLRHAHESHDAADIIKGFGLFETQMLQTLSDNDIKPIESVGRMFDPEIHHAVTTDVTGDVPPGTVTEELGRGFMIDDFVIRPAQVKVAAAPPKEDDET
jgi:molecular chaperone GrpE